MASIDALLAARDFPRALRALEEAQAELDAGEWWDGPPPHMVSRRDEAADWLADVVRKICEAGE